MPKYKVRRNITGAVNGVGWPGIGEVIELAVDVKSMVEAGALELVEEAKAKVEKRPASKADTETRKD